MNNLAKVLSFIAFLSAAAAENAGQALNISVASTGGNTTSPLAYGIMFEDINHSGDGGIFAELVQNRAFQGSSIYPSNLDAWYPVGDASLSLQNLSNPLSSALPTSMRLSTNATIGTVGLLNTGWWGIDVQVQQYTGSFWVKGSYNGSFTVSLQSDLTNETFGSVEAPCSASSSNWKQHNFTITPAKAAPNSNNTFAVTFDASGASNGYLDFNLISLFPPTWKDRPNGMRIDLMEALAELSPSFLRLPGDDNLEGLIPPYLRAWNETIGPLKYRPGRPGTWGYGNTDGLELIEYMLWC
jgi:alpha-L-arabinofuranosidase